MSAPDTTCEWKTRARIAESCALANKSVCEALRAQRDDLLAALRKIISTMERDCDDIDGVPYYADMLKVARAALTRATQGSDKV